MIWLTIIEQLWSDGVIFVRHISCGDWKINFQFWLVIHHQWNLIKTRQIFINTNILIFGSNLDLAKIDLSSVQIYFLKNSGPAKRRNQFSWGCWLLSDDDNNMQMGGGVVISGKVGIGMFGPDGCLFSFSGLFVCLF